jgi:hypothetical protein
MLKRAVDLKERDMWFNPEVSTRNCKLSVTKEIAG